MLDLRKQSKSVVMIINAGEISTNHWTQDLQIGGGRLNGEVCHFIDLLRYLIGFPIESYNKLTMDSECEDTITVSIRFKDGSIGTIHYFANGNKSIPKERIEIYVGNSIIQLDNYKSLKAYGWPGFKKQSLWSQDKGQSNCVNAFINAIAYTHENPIPINEIFEITEVTLNLSKSEN